MTDDFTPDTPAATTPQDDFVADDFVADTVQPKAPSLGARVVGAGKAIGKGAWAVAQGLSEAAMSPVTMEQAKIQGGQLEKTMNALPSPNVDDLKAKGYSDEAIHNILKGYADTEQSLASDVEEMGKTGVKSATEALATYGTLPLGGMGGAAAAGEAAVAKVGLAKVAEQAAEGAAFGGAYGLAKGGIGEGAAAAERGEGAGQIFGHILGGAAKEGTINAALGAVLSPVLHGVMGGFNKLVNGKAMAQEALMQAATKSAAVEAFDKSYHPTMIGDRFAADVAAAKTAGLSDDQLAAQLVGKLMNVAPEAADPALIKIMTKKLAQYRELSGARIMGSASALYPEVNLPKVPEGVPPVEKRIPLSTDIEPTGGIPPQGAAEDRGVIPPAQNPQPFAAGQGVPLAPPEGFEPGKPSAAAPPAPVVPEGVAPQPETQQLNQPPVLSKPAGIAPAAAPEPQATTLAPREMPAPTEPPTAQMTPGVPFTEVQPAAPKPQVADKAVASVPKVKLSEGPSRSPADASFNMNSLGKPTGQAGWQAIGDVAYRTSMSTDGKTVELNYLENLGDEKGAGSAVLKKLTKVADDHQVPMTLDALPLPRGNGKGKIPLDKLIAFYKSHGFEVVERGEGFSEGEGWATMRREPTPVEKVTPEVATALKAAAPDAKVMAGRIEGLTNDRAHVAGGNVTEGSPLIPGKAILFTRLDEHLGRIAKEADKRILMRRLMKGDEVHTGLNVDPEHLKDLTISAAAKIFQKGIRSTKALIEALVNAHGEWVRPHAAKAVEAGRRMLERLIANDKPAAKQLAEIRASYESGKVGKDWYNQTWAWLNEHFGGDAEMVARFISATSLGNSTDANATQMLKAYAQWKLGQPFEGHLNENHTVALNKAVRGEVFGDGKAQGFLGALIGDENAVALDRHVMRVLGFKNAGKETGKSALSNSTYKLYSSIIRDLAQEAGVTPREYQAGLWVGKKIADEQVAHATGVATRGGSFRPMEVLIKDRLNGLTPSEWVEVNRVNIMGIRNASEGVTKARAHGGYSFNPADFSEFKKPGFTVTLDHRVVPIGEASGMKVIEHAKRFKDLTDRFHGTHTGLWQPAKLGEKGQEMHMDFNIHIPDHPENLEFAKKLGLEGRQYAVGYTDAAGKYHDIATGYDPAVHGEQFPPRRVSEVEALLEKMGAPTKDAPDSWSKFLPPTMSEQGKFQFDPEVHEFAIQNPAFALDKYAQVAGKTPDEIKTMINDGMFKPMTDAGVAGGVFVGKDGIVHQYVDPVAPSYNTTRVVGSLRKHPGAMLEQLKGMDILRGHDVIEKYRNEGGFLAITPKGHEALRSDNAEMLSKMMSVGGAKVASPEMLTPQFLGANASMNGFWLFPNGRLIWIPYMSHSAHADLLKLPKMYDYIGTEGSAGAKVQHLLNHGIVRIQASGQSIAFDASAELTAKQREIILNAAKGRRSWAAQITDEKGKFVSFFSADNSKPHQFTAALNK